MTGTGVPPPCQAPPLGILTLNSPPRYPLLSSEASLPARTTAPCKRLSHQVPVLGPAPSPSTAWYLGSCPRSWCSRCRPAMCCRGRSPAYGAFLRTTRSPGEGGEVSPTHSPPHPHPLFRQHTSADVLLVWVSGIEQTRSLSSESLKSQRPTDCEGPCTSTLEGQQAGPVSVKGHRTGQLQVPTGSMFDGKWPRC